MVSEQKDMLGLSDAKPDTTYSVGQKTKRKVKLAEEISDNGEAQLLLKNGDVIEIHGHDAHFFADSGIIFTEHGDEETWVFAEEIMTVGRH